MNLSESISTKEAEGCAEGGHAALAIASGQRVRKKIEMKKFEKPKGQR